MGFKAIRTQVTWHNHLINQKYTVNPEWFNRLKTVVDYCRDKGLYAIINIIHDNASLKKNLLNTGRILSIKKISKILEYYL